MSSPSRVALTVLAGIALTALAGCTVRPLYATTATEAGPQADLPAINVQSPTTRAEQVYRNDLIFGFTGGGDAPDARYGLIYRMTIRQQEIAVERGTGTPNLYQLTGGVSFLLKDISTGNSLFGASVTAIDTYTRSSQNFANIRAERDAEDRLSKTLAQLTQARLAAFFATHH
jgi:LPS-assembly lipoprotein